MTTDPLDLGFGAAGLHVWVLALDFIDETGTERWLDAAERERALRYSSAAARSEFSLTRAALRLLLGGYLRRAPAAVRIASAAHGKPVLADPAPLHFNVSHTSGVALLAFAALYEVGIDVEAQRPLPDLASLAERVFDRRDAAAWSALPETDQLAAFYRAWTRKEACAKASGEGLRADLASLHVSLGTEPVTTASGRERGSLWTVQAVALGDHGSTHCAAIACQGSVAPALLTRTLNAAAWAALARAASARAA